MEIKGYRRLCKKYAKLRGLIDPYDSNDSWIFSRESAIYWFANYWHSGQWSDLYKVLCQSEYKPSILSKNAKDDLKEDCTAWELFKFLNRRARHFSKIGQGWRV
jgi:hypothetical protein